ncbi:MAG: hypothetical protein R1F54_01380 [Candidatus Zeuxoniibacter abyssi]|nr:MAG: hypothetical protein R1F54_01380 [Candidatus Persebacteraceae bacterium AB1(2)]
MADASRLHRVRKGGSGHSKGRPVAPEVISFIRDHRHKTLVI